MLFPFVLRYLLEKMRNERFAVRTNTRGLPFNINITGPLSFMYFTTASLKSHFALFQVLIAMFSFYV
jgi:hypothetical protein